MESSKGTQCHAADAPTAHAGPQGTGPTAQYPQPTPAHTGGGAHSVSTASHSRSSLTVTTIHQTLGYWGSFGANINQPLLHRARINHRSSIESIVAACVSFKCQGEISEKSTSTNHIISVFFLGERQPLFPCTYTTGPSQPQSVDILLTSPAMIVLLLDCISITLVE